MSKNITSTTSEGQNRRDHGSRNVSSSFQEPYKNPNLQNIEFDNSAQRLEDPIVSGPQRLLTQ